MNKKSLVCRVAPGKSLLYLTLLVYALLLAPALAYPESSFVLDRVVAIVNKEVITWAEVYRAMQFDFAPQMQSMSAEEKRSFLQKQEAGYLGKMIDMALQLQEAKRKNLEVSDKDIDEAISSIRKKYSMDDKAFSEALKNEGFTMEEYRHRLSEQILVSKVVTSEVRDKINVSEAEIDAYIKKKGLKDRSGDAFRLSQIFFRMPDGPAGKAGVEKRAGEALAKIQAGGDFLTVARAYSQADPDIGLIKRDSLSGQMQSVLDGMKSGDVSKPFWTDQGLYIIKLEEKISSARPEDVKGNAKKELVDADFEQAYKAWLRGLRENSYVEIRL